MKIKLFITLTLILSGCASIPPEFLTSMEKERDGIILLQERHKRTVSELVNNWYEERLERLLFIKELEIKKITIIFPDPNGGNGIEVIEKESLLKIEKQFDVALETANLIRVSLINGYHDGENWDKLQKLNTLNIKMSRSLLELNQAQRKFYSELIGQSIPFPTDFINEKTKELLNK